MWLPPFHASWDIHHSPQCHPCTWDNRGNQAGRLQGRSFQDGTNGKALPWLGSRDGFFFKDFTCDKLILSPGSSRGAWHIRISQNQGKNKEKEEHLDRSPNPLADVDPVSPVSISPGTISASTGVPQCPCLHTLLSKSKLTYGFNNGAFIERVELNFSRGKDTENYFQNTIDPFLIPLILFEF